VTIWISITWLAASPALAKALSVACAFVSVYLMRAGLVFAPKSA
jgi:hypothetical protein